MDGKLTCARCEANILLAEAPGLLKQPFPCALHVAGASAIEGPAEVTASRRTATALTCKGCGAPLSPEKNGETVACEYCQTVTRLTPRAGMKKGAARRREWYVIFDPALVGTK